MTITNNTAWTTDRRLTPWLATEPAATASAHSLTPSTDAVPVSDVATGDPKPDDFELEDDDLDDDPALYADLDDLDDSTQGSAEPPMPVPPALPPMPRPKPVGPARSDALLPPPDQQPGTDSAAVIAPDVAPTPEPGSPAVGKRPRTHPCSGSPAAATPVLGDLVRHRKARPTRGWRGVAYAVSRGAWNPGLSSAEDERRSLITRARTQLPGWHTVTVTNMKGGIGKTTVTAGLGLTLAEHRGDRLVALDANPDAGTLADRLTGHCGITVRELIQNLATIKSWTDIAHYTSLAGRLQVLASEQDPAMSEAFSRAEYEAVCEVLTRFYNVILTDSGTGLVHSAMGGALDGTKTLVIAASPTVDGASRSSKTLDWLIAHGYGELVERAVVALSCDRSSRYVDRAAILSHFQARCHAVVEIPPDPHLAIGGLINLDELRQDTRDAFLRLAGAVAEQFGWDDPRTGALR
jgi:MinD-like ATPase involved in chromosome partitioning or flagellar assembly